MQIFLGLRPTETLVRVVRDLDDEGRVLWVPFGKTSHAKRRLQIPDALREVLLLHAKGKPSDAPLLGNPSEPFHTRDIIRYRLKLLCQQLGLPTVCPHSLRGLNATLALDAGPCGKSRSGSRRRDIFRSVAGSGIRTRCAS